MNKKNIINHKFKQNNKSKTHNRIYKYNFIQYAQTQSKNLSINNNIANFNDLF